MGAVVQTEIAQQRKPILLSEVRLAGGNQPTDSSDINELNVVQEPKMPKSYEHVLWKLHKVLLGESVDLDYSLHYVL